MKKFILYFIILILALAFSGCNTEEMLEDNTVVLEEPLLEEPEKITLKLGASGEEKEYSAGDSIGEWKIAELYIDKEENGEYFEVSARFEGSVTLEGYIERSQITEDGYCFISDESSLKKMPYCIAGDFSEIKNNFFLHFPMDFTDFPNLSGEETAKVRITVSAFSLSRAPRMGMDGFDVVSIEYLDEKVPTKAQKINFRLGNSEEKKELSVGDKIGVWTLEQLEALPDSSKEEEFYDHITATFSGEVRLKGYISHHPYANAGYIFSINDFNDMNKIPTVEENFSFFKQEFAINTTQIENFPTIGENEWYPCYITIDKFYIFRSYTEGMDRANVVKIEEPSKDTGLSPLYEDIILNFGARVNAFGELGVNKGPSLYYSTNGYADFSKERAQIFYVWVVAKSNAENRAEVYLPDYGTTVYAFPEEYFEAEVQKYFAVSTEDLRSSKCYYPEQKVYFYEFGGGIGETPALIINSIEEKEDTVTFDLTVKYSINTEDNSNMLLTVKILPDGGYNYISYLPK